MHQRVAFAANVNREALIVVLGTMSGHEHSESGKNISNFGDNTPEMNWHIATPYCSRNVRLSGLNSFFFRRSYCCISIVIATRSHIRVMIFDFLFHKFSPVKKNSCIFANENTMVGKFMARTTQNYHKFQSLNHFSHENKNVFSR